MNTATPRDNTDEFVISRLFDAPRELMWKVWTETEHLKQWFGPKGVTMPSCSMSLRPGGVFHYCMRMPDGNEMWGKWIFREIVAPERIVVITSFSDAAGNLTRHPMNPDWPLEMLSTTLFSEQQGKTKITIHWAPHNATAAERKTFEDEKASMHQGWSGTFEQLERYLEEAQASSRN
ncbi:MAG TPA: SRPBCC domain-containing protein [Gammaproteobacteria bacterium]|nr:SRPBCC domain-containing protein [Gammaproteobacteria bacterium]